MTNKERTPQVGDVWESPFEKYLILVREKEYCIFLRSNLSTGSLPEHFFERTKYLGRSQVDLSKLFEVGEVFYE